MDFESIQNNPRTMSVEEYEQQSAADQLNSELDDLLASGYPTTAADRDTLGIMGAGVSIGNIELPPVCAGAISLLEMIESPFVCDNKECGTVDDILRALYILTARDQAVAAVSEVKRAEEAIEKARPFAEASPEMFDVYLKHTTQIQEKYSVFDQHVRELANIAGVFNIPEAVQTLEHYIREAFTGTALYPDPTEDPTALKKKDALTVNG